MAKPNLGTIVLSLTPEEIMRVERIMLDRNRDDALDFIVGCVGPRVEEILKKPH